MPYRYFNYYGRPARLTVDDKEIPQLCEVWDPEQKKLVPSDWIETDIFFNTDRSDLLSEDEFAALLERVQQGA